MEEVEEVEEERGLDPTMPQILCVTGGSLEDREEEQEAGQREEEQEQEPWRPATEEVSPPPGEEPTGGEAGPVVSPASQTACCFEA